MAFEALKKTLERNGFKVSVFDTGAEASAYLNQEIDKTTVGFGGSLTIAQLGLRESLGTHNMIFSHGYSPADRNQVQRMAARTNVYMLSANGIAEDTGEILNIDGLGNRIASSAYGHDKVYILAGKNKISPDYETALDRVRNVVAPKNAQRLKKKTPCALRGDKCYDCKSPDRICCGLLVLYRAMHGMDMEVVLIDEELGY